MFLTCFGNRYRSWCPGQSRAQLPQCTSHTVLFVDGAPRRAVDEMTQRVVLGFVDKKSNQSRYKMRCLFEVFNDVLWDYYRVLIYRDMKQCNEEVVERGEVSIASAKTNNQKNSNFSLQISDLFASSFRKYPGAVYLL